MIGYGERTMAEIVEAYESRSAARGMGSGSAGGQGEGIHYLLDDLTPEQVQGLGVEEPWRSCRATAQCYDLKEGQVEQQRPG